MAIYARLENGTYAEVTGVYKTDGTEVTEIFQGDRLVYSATNEIYGTLPLYYSGRGFELIDYLISGNTVQDGTPSPDAPVDATGSGVRTGNLCNVSNENVLTYTSAYNNFSIDDDTQSIAITGNALFGLLVPVTPDTEYAVYANSTKYGLLRVREYSDKPSVWQGTEYIRQSINRVIGSAYNFITTAQTKWLVVTFYFETANAGAVISDTMLNLGSTALPYEPYGFKLPLTVNGTEYPIYLGTVPTTRRIKKLVLTGEERWSANTTASLPNIIMYMPVSDSLANTIPICTHYIGSNTNTWAGLGVDKITVSILSGGVYRLAINAGTATLDDFKSYLAAQYQNGTPVTVWYVLAEPETAIVNEPLMKIGDYADTISFAQSGVTIPTVNEANVLDMASPVKPSEVYIKGKGIKPTGYGQLADVNGVNILDKDGTKILVHGQ